MTGGFTIKVDKDCPYLDMENLVCTYDEITAKKKKYQAIPKCINCKIALYELWKRRQEQEIEID